MNQIDSAKGLTISRTFAAHRALVFKAWTTAEHMRRWFHPVNYSVPHATIDCRDGGAFELCMEAADGTRFWSKGHFSEVVPPERLRFVTSLSIGDGAPGCIIDTRVEFANDHGSTTVTVHQTYEVLDAAFMDSVNGSPEGWRTTLDNLATELARMEKEAPIRSAVHGSFTLSRDFTATPAQVFHALTDMSAKAKWFEGGDGYSTVKREMNVQPGGREHLQGRWENGTVSTFDAIYFDIVPNERLVYSYEMHLNGTKISVSLASMQIEARPGGSRLTVTEQGVFLDGYEDAGSREHGTGFLLDRLRASLEA